MKHETPVATDTITAEVDAAALTKALRRFSRLVERRNTIPILGGVAIEAKPSGIKITGTNLDTEMTLDVAGSGAGAVVVPLRRLQAVVSAVGNTGLVKLTRGKKDGWLSIAGDGLTARVATYPISDFPRMILADPVAPPAVFPEGALASLLSFVQPAISAEETRYYLNGVHLTGPQAAAHPVEGVALAAAATNGHILMVRSFNLVAPPPAALDVIVPRGAVTLLLAAIGDGECEAEFWPLHARFRGEGVTISTKLIDGTFPDVLRVIPSWSDATVIEFAGAGVRRVARATAKAFAQCAIRIEPGADGVCLSAGRVEHHEVEASVETDGAWRHGSLDPVGFDAAYLLRVIGAFPASAKLEMSGASIRDPWRFRPAGDTETSDIVVVMPMRV